MGDSDPSQKTDFEQSIVEPPQPVDPEAFAAIPSADSFMPQSSSPTENRDISFADFFAMPFEDRFETVAAQTADIDVGRPRPAPGEAESGDMKRIKIQTERAAAPTLVMPEAPALAPPYELDELLELSEAGLSVEWPPGWTESSARSAKRERPVAKETSCTAAS